MPKARGHIQGGKSYKIGVLQHRLIAGQIVALIAFVKAAIIKRKVIDNKLAMKAVSPWLKAAGIITVVGIILTGTGITIGLN